MGLLWVHSEGKIRAGPLCTRSCNTAASILSPPGKILRDESSKVKGESC